MHVCRNCSLCFFCIFTVLLGVVQYDIGDEDALKTLASTRSVRTFVASGGTFRWRKWKRAFEYYAEGQSLTDAKKKTAQLLHFAGMDLQDLFEDLPDPGPVPEEDDEYKKAMRKLDNRFKTEDNFPYERHIFRQMSFHDSETADQFITRLRKQARHCNFGAALEDNLRDQLIEKVKDLELKKRLLETKNVTLEQALNKTRAWESANLQVKDMSGVDVGAPKAQSEAVNLVKPSGDGKRNLVCHNCGREGHIRRDRNCPARGKKCAKCSKIGHFAVCCRGEEVTRGETSKDKASKREQRGRWQRGSTNQVVDQEESGDSSEDDFTFSVSGDKTGVHAVYDEPVVPVSINGIVKNMLIDSGSVSNLMSIDEYEELKTHGLDASLFKCDRRLFAYGGKQLSVRGQFSAELLANGRKIQSTFVVTDKGRCLLGHSASKELGILRIDTAASIETVCSNTMDTDIKSELQAKYPRVFSGIGKLTDYKLKLHVDENVTPVAQKPRRIPFALRDKVTAKVQELIDKDIVEKVEGPTSWVSPIVVAPKASGDIRLCVDMRRANEAIIRERIPIPTVDEVLENLNGSTIFSKLDLRLGFHQIELDEDSRDLTTFATHDGLFRYKRLMFGVSSAPEKYQQVIRQVVAGISGVQNIADDLVVHGKNQADHDRNLESVIRRLEERNLTLNPEKCSFRMDKVVFMGLLLSKYGVGPTEERVRSVLEAIPPTSASEVRSFLGMVGFSSRFIPNFATISEPLRAVTRQGTTFKWGNEQQDAFEKLKKSIIDAPVLAYFDKDAHTSIVTDASPVGLGAVLIQEKEGVSRVVCYASRSLSDVERRYSQTEKEALGIVWGCERFHLYLQGLDTFDLVTDHEPLKVIYSSRSKPSARIERWVLRLQPYNYKVRCVRSKDNIADALSRLTKQEPTNRYKCDDEHVRAVALQAVPVAMSIQEIEKASAVDSELQEVRKCLITGNWERSPKPYVPVRNELTYIGHIILRGTRIVVPTSLRKRVTELAHEGHQGIVKTKERLRSKVWWPGIDRDAERKCRECYGCQVVVKEYRPPTVKATKIPDRPWQDLALDLLGPMPTGEHLIVLVDYHSRWMEVDITRSTSSEKIIRCLDAHFARYGVPKTLRTDNGSNLVSEEMEEYLTEMGIKHKRTTPLWPRANGEVERQNRSLLKAMRVAHAEKRNWRTELNKFLLAYRSTAHTTTGKSPAELLFGRNLSTKLPDIGERGEIDDPREQQVKDHDAERKQSAADYADKRYQSTERQLETGDLVLLEKKKEDKLSPSYESEPYKVTARYGDQVHIESPQGVEYKRNIKHLKQFHQPTWDQTPDMLIAVQHQPPEPTCTEDQLGVQTPTTMIPGQEMSTEIGQGQSKEKEVVAPRRSSRITKVPERFQDFIIGKG